MDTIPNNGYTHAGVFHADDVFSAALLGTLNPEIKIQRGFKPPEQFDGIVFDVGGGEFDHHGESRRLRQNGVPYASFGLLWERFGSLLLHEDDFHHFDEVFVQPIDAADNGGEPCQLSQLVSDFNPFPPASPVEYDEAFNNAASWATDILSRRLRHIRQSREARDYVSHRMDECNGSILVLDHLVPWKEVVVGSTYTYVIYPSIRGGFNVQAVPEHLGDHSMVLPFPQSWRGASAGALQSITGIEDITFCHASGFLCATNSLEGSLRAAHLSLINNGTCEAFRFPSTINRHSDNALPLFHRP